MRRILKEADINGSPALSEDLIKEKVDVFYQKNCKRYTKEGHELDEVDVEIKGSRINISTSIAVKAYGDSWGSWEEWSYYPITKKIIGKEGGDKNPGRQPESIEPSQDNFGLAFQSLVQWLNETSDIVLTIVLRFDTWHD